MDIQKTMDNLRRNEFKVSFFATKEEAAEYLNKAIDGKTVGFGDSKTLEALDMYNLLKTHNTVYDPVQVQSEGEEEFCRIGKKALDTDIFLLSANGISETGELVNIDGTGNRVAGSLFGHDKVYFVAGTNKIRPSLQDAIDRARNIAAPLDTMKFGYRTPCAVKGDRCYDCHSPQRICNALVIHMQKMNNMDMEVILIDEGLGF